MLPLPRHLRILRLDKAVLQHYTTCINYCILSNCD